jgi:hypothetical protein
LEAEDNIRKGLLTPFPKTLESIRQAQNTISAAEAFVYY